ncbi:MAG: D-glycero-beta-D-manno-heptose 1-phosphate adenylyltransferase, partial [Rhizobiales bacterium]|nr:D-glycero-beta-D-manno-heptose 1-phosphate adenylyltransferase [Hyphomicrobiales bacterium]
QSTHLLRADWETARPVSAKIEAMLIRHAIAMIRKAGAVVLSDYAKGVLTERVIRAVIASANASKIPVVVDPKGRDFSIYRGATLITPNRKELAEATEYSVDSHEDVAAAADKLARTVGSKAVLVTLSEEGMLLYVRGRAPVHVPSYPVKVRDVSGAGDTVVAALAALLAVGADFESAARAANAAASVVVGKRGTATVSIAELRHRVLPSATLAPEEKIVFDWKELDERFKEWRVQDQRIGFTNGCFDILHPGHIKVLAQARAACDRLVVGLNSDASVKRLKGAGRPMQNEIARAEVLAALEAVDLVVIFPQDTPLELIRRVRPSVLVKGGDYRRDQVIGREIVEKAGGKVLLVDLVPGYSTTRIIDQSRKNARKKKY